VPQLVGPPKIRNPNSPADASDLFGDAGWQLIIRHSALTPLEVFQHDAI
jgi:hypothetical protein